MTFFLSTSKRILSTSPVYPEIVFVDLYTLADRPAMLSHFVYRLHGCSLMVHFFAVGAAGFAVGLSLSCCQQNFLPGSVLRVHFLPSSVTAAHWVTALACCQQYLLPSAASRLHRFPSSVVAWHWVATFACCQQSFRPSRASRLHGDPSWVFAIHCAAAAIAVIRQTAVIVSSFFIVVVPFQKFSSPSFLLHHF